MKTKRLLPKKAAPMKAVKTEFTVTPPVPQRPLEVAVSVPREEEIAHQAYLLWEKAGCPEGHDQEFWFLAERNYEQNKSLPAWLLDRSGLRPLVLFQDC